MAFQKRASLLAFLLLHIVTVTMGDEAKLVILPDGGNLVRPIGANIVLTCKGEVPDPELTLTDLRWLGPDGHDLPNGDSEGYNGRISSEDLGSDVGRSLFIKGLQEADSGRYTCAAVYTGSQRLEAHVNLTTIVGITWEDAPTEQSAIFGRPYKVRCVVRANPPATIDWQKNGQSFTTNNNYVIENDGVLIREVSAEDDTFFTCRARVQTTGQLEDRRIRVEVFIPPEFVREPTNTSVVEGETATLECTSSGKPDPVYTWVDRNNQNLKGRERYTIDEQRGTLTISNVMRSDAGDIKCLVENQAGKIDKAASLNVIIKPTVVELLNVTGVSGREVNLTCKAAGDPLPEVTFVKEGSLVPFLPGVQASDSRYILDTVRVGEYAEARLLIRDLLRSDDGLYACLAKNSGGNVTKNGHITVEFPPSFALTPMREAWTWNNHIVNLTCRAESIPNATITWFYHERNLENDRNVQIYTFNGESTLTVTPNLDHQYYGEYQCLAMNVHGKASHSIMLREARPPGPLLQVKFQTITATTITFDFIGPVDNGGLPIDAFAVQYKLHGREWGDKPSQRIWPVGAHNRYDMHDIESHAADIPYILENLEPQLMYVFRFAAKNQVGFGEWSREEVHTMPKRAPPEEPSIIAKIENRIVTSSYPDRYELLWTAPANNGEPIDYFEVVFYPVRNTTTNWVEAGQSVRAQVPYPAQPKYDMKNLKPDSFYRVELRAHNVIGFSAPAEIYLRTAKDPSSPPGGPGGWTSSGSRSPPVLVLLLVPFFALLSSFFAL